MRLFLAIALICTLPSLFNTSVCQASSGFISNCFITSLSVTTVSAFCTNNREGFTATSINANNCVDADEGGLFCAGAGEGGYANSCSGCALQGSMFCCAECQGADPGPASCLDLNTCFGNSNGQLVC